MKEQKSISDLTGVQQGIELIGWMPPSDADRRGHPHGVIVGAIRPETPAISLKAAVLRYDGKYVLTIGHRAQAPQRRTAKRDYIGLDVSKKETAISIRREGKRIWRGKCPSDPKIIAGIVRKHAPHAERVVFETGPLSVWFYHALKEEGLPAICIDARHAKAALDMAANKTDANDADGLAQLAEVGFFREVRVKGFDSMLTRTLVAARTRLVGITIELSNQIRGVMKTFGLIVPPGKGSNFDKNVRHLLADQDALASIVLPLLEAWRSIRLKAAVLERRMLADARQRQECLILMSIPGIGVITATSFLSAVEDPDNFKKSRSVGAWLGLTTRRYQSGEVDYDGHISRRGDRHLRGLLFEAATVILTRTSAESGLRTWGLKLRERVGFKRAAVAVARKLAVTMHAMLKTGEFFDRAVGAAA